MWVVAAEGSAGSSLLRDRDVVAHPRVRRRARLAHVFHTLRECVARFARAREVLARETTLRGEFMSHRIATLATLTTLAWLLAAAPAQSAEQNYDCNQVLSANSSQVQLLAGLL